MLKLHLSVAIAKIVIAIKQIISHDVLLYLIYFRYFFCTRSVGEIKHYKKITLVRLGVFIPRIFPVSSLRRGSLI